MNKIILLILAVSLLSCKPKEDVDIKKIMEIHVINVQQGDATLIIGPDGTTLLIDGGDTGYGKNDVVPYLQKLGIKNSIDYMVNTHRHADHLGGLDELIKAGYDVRKFIWDNGSNKADTQAISDFLEAATTTTAGSVKTIPLGQVIDFGNGAKATAVAVGGSIVGATTTLSVTEENDQSVALLIQYGLFDYMMSGDLGGGDDDTACTGRTSGQKNIETTLINALMPGGGAGLLTVSGVEAMMVPHHGSETSMNSDFMNRLSPRVAIISVGEGQGPAFQHPRKDIVEKVLMAEATSCITAKPAMVLQTDEGGPIGTDTSNKGFVAGDIVIKTNGVTTFQVSGSGRVRPGSPDERVDSRTDTPLTLPMD
jgi:beta-lactamase superfamily II metal-dependent hydrolase